MRNVLTTKQVHLLVKIVIIFDYDDTLFCTTHHEAMKSIANEDSHKIEPNYKEISESVVRLKNLI